jgi:hypothetical protein
MSWILKLYASLNFPLSPPHPLFFDPISDGRDWDSEMWRGGSFYPLFYNQKVEIIQQGKNVKGSNLTFLSQYFLNGIG